MRFACLLVVVAASLLAASAQDVGYVFAEVYSKNTYGTTSDDVFIGTVDSNATFNATHQLDLDAGGVSFLNFNQLDDDGTAYFGVVYKNSVSFIYGTTSNTTSVYAKAGRSLFNFCALDGVFFGATLTKNKFDLVFAQIGSTSPLVLLYDQHDALPSNCVTDDTALYFSLGTSTTSYTTSNANVLYTVLPDGNHTSSGLEDGLLSSLFLEKHSRTLGYFIQGNSSGEWNLHTRSLDSYSAGICVTVEAATIDFSGVSADGTVYFGSTDEAGTQSLCTTNISSCGTPECTPFDKSLRIHSITPF